MGKEDKMELKFALKTLKRSKKTYTRQFKIFFVCFESNTVLCHFIEITADFIY